MPVGGKEEGSGRQGMVFEIRVHGALREEKICHSICENDSRYYYFFLNLPISVEKTREYHI